MKSLQNVRAEAAHFKRPGVTDEFLTIVGCHHVGSDESVTLYGCRAEGIAIPFFSLDGQPIVDGGKQFVRIRLYTPTESQKYHQPVGSKSHIYIPTNFRELPRGATLTVTEGEFKAMSLVQAGFAAVGLCGINGAMRNADGEAKLHEELVEILKFQKPATVVFLGDSDAVFNAEFSRECAKLRKALFGSKEFPFVTELRVALCPLGGGKGVDDVREVMGNGFNAWFTALADKSFVVPAKATPIEIFCTLLGRELEAVRAAVTSGDTHEAHRNRVKLLQSADKFQHEPGAMLLLKPILAELLDVKPTTITGLIRDAGKASGEEKQTPASPEKGRVTLRNVEPWDKAVNGDELLTQIAAFYNTYCWLPAHAAFVLAVWTLQVWCYGLFDFAAIIAVWSPEEQCGKGRVLDSAEKVVRRPFRTSNTSAAVLYHVISKGNLTVLVDELDSVNEEQRAAICNILKGGFQFNGTAHRMAKDSKGDQIEIEFSTYCPKMIATITMDKLDKATRSRTIGIQMQRKPRTVKLAKFRRVDTTELQRKCLRWAQDNADALKAVPPMDVDECATDRQEDVWEPMVAIARVVGGEWEKRIREAAKQLTGLRSDGASETESHQLLAAFQSYFAKHGARVETKTFIASLDEAGDFTDVNRGRGLSPHYIAKVLKPYGIEPAVLKIPGNKAARGYSRENFEQVFETYLDGEKPETASQERNNVTRPENIDESPPFENVTELPGYVSESAIPSNETKGSNGVTVSKGQKALII